ALELQPRLEIPQGIHDEVDDERTVIHHEDSPRRLGLDWKAVGGSKSLELLDGDPEVPTGRPDRTKLGLRDPFLHGWRRHLASPGDVARGEVSTLSSHCHANDDSSEFSSGGSNVDLRTADAVVAHLTAGVRLRQVQTGFFTLL